MVDDAPQAILYYSDLFATYRNLIYTPGIYTPMPDKSETFRVEGDNAEFRHYLARLARRSRCFSRCIRALREAIKLFVYAWNSRQLYKSQYPNYPAHVMEFVWTLYSPLPSSGSGEKAVYAILDNMNVKCPHCQNEADQVKAGKTNSGSQRYKCKLCNRVYTPEPKQQGYEDAIRHQAVKLYVDGMNYRRIARHLGVDHKSVINWVKAYTSQLPDAPQPKAVIKAEMDELFTFIGSKKTGLYNDDRGS